MPEQLLKKFSISVDQKLNDHPVPEGNLAIYQTSPFGLLAMLNDQIMMTESDSFIFNEMMAHPALFSHPKPKKIAIIGHSFGILPEILKHASVHEVHCISPHQDVHDLIAKYFPQQAVNDSRINVVSLATNEWLQQCPANSFDIMIQTEVTNLSSDHFAHYFHGLRDDGLFVQALSASLLQLETIKPTYQQVLQAGFHDWQLLNFPQPSFPGGWRTISISTKQAPFKRAREKEIFNRPFTTRYYNFDVHQAAFVLPEFARLTWEKN